MLLSFAHTGRVVDSLNNPCQNIHCLYLTWFGAHGGAAHSSLPTAGEVDLTLGTMRLPGDEPKVFIILHSCSLPLARAAVAMDGSIPCAAHSIKLFISSYCPVSLSKSILSILIRMSVYSLTASSAPHDSDTRFQRSAIFNPYSTHAEWRKWGRVKWEGKEPLREACGHLSTMCCWHASGNNSCNTGGRIFWVTPPHWYDSPSPWKPRSHWKLEGCPPHAHGEHNEREEFFVTLVFYKPFCVGLGKLGTLLVKTITWSCALLCHFGSSAPCSHYAVL